MSSESEDWSPENEKGPDQLIELSKKLMASGNLIAKKNEPLSFEEMEVLLTRAWQVANKIAPGAPPEVLGTMVHCFSLTKNK